MCLTFCESQSSSSALTQEDLIYDAIHYDSLPLEDFVLRKSDGLPTYHFANVVDDYEMGITHVLRGEVRAFTAPPSQLALTVFIRRVGARAGMAPIDAEAPPAVRRARLAPPRVCPPAAARQSGWEQVEQARGRRQGRGLHCESRSPPPSLVVFALSGVKLQRRSPGRASADAFTHRQRATSPKRSSTLSPSWAGPRSPPPPPPPTPRPSPGLPPRATTSTRRSSPSPPSSRPSPSRASTRTARRCRVPSSTFSTGRTSGSSWPMRERAEGGKTSRGGRSRSSGASGLSWRASGSSRPMSRACSMRSRCVLTSSRLGYLPYSGHPP